MSPEQTLIKFFENTSSECLTAVTVVVELLTKYKLSKDEVKQVVENSISAASFLIDKKKKSILLEANLEISKAYNDALALYKLGKITVDYDDNIDDSTSIRMRLKQFKSVLMVAGESDREYRMYENIAHNISDDIIESIDWKDPLASKIISDSSTVVESLTLFDKKTFMIPASNMCPTLSSAIKLECGNLLNSYNTFNDDLYIMNIMHNKKWIDDLDAQKKFSKDIFNVLCRTWQNNNFTSHNMRKEISEGTYMAEVILPLFSAVVPMRKGVRLTTAEKQSKAIKWRRKEEGKKFGLKPDAMLMLKNHDREFEIMYLECSRITSDDKKIKEDEVKLFRELNTGMDFANACCNNLSSEFAIAGIQVACEDIFLNILIKDNNKITRYFHLCQARIPFNYCSRDKLIDLVNLLLTFRNIMNVNINIVKNCTSKVPRRIRNSIGSSTAPSPNKKKKY